MNNLVFVEALGHLLANYITDLTYILNFKKFKSGELSFSEYISKNDGSLKRFLNEFRVTRNIKKENVNEFLEELHYWVFQNDCDNVDDLALLIIKKRIYPE